MTLLSTNIQVPRVRSLRHRLALRFGGALERASCGAFGRTTAAGAKIVRKISDEVHKQAKEHHVNLSLLRTAKRHEVSSAAARSKALAHEVMATADGRSGAGAGGAEAGAGAVVALNSPPRKKKGRGGGSSGGDDEQQIQQPAASPLNAAVLLESADRAAKRKEEEQHVLSVNRSVRHRRTLVKQHTMAMLKGQQQSGLHRGKFEEGG